MVAKCANPECSTQFRYLREGRLFAIPTSSPRSRKANPNGSVEFAWLCNECAARFWVRFDAGQGLVLVPLKNPGSASTGRRLRLDDSLDIA